MEKLWSHIFEKLKRTEDNSVLFTEPTLNAAGNSEKTLQSLFETFNFNRV